MLLWQYIVLRGQLAALLSSPCNLDNLTHRATLATVQQREDMRQCIRRLAESSRALPQLTTKELLAQGRVPSFSVTYRDFMEWNNIQVARHGRFFEKRNAASLSQLHSLGRAEPLLCHALARWMHVDYKLNSYPYYDLNVLLVYTDWDQAQRVAGALVAFLERVQAASGQRVNCFLAPLHDAPAPARRRAAVPPGVRVLDSGLLLGPEPCRMEDPVYVVLMNDVVRYLSCDLVRMGNGGDWQQMHLDVEKRSTQRVWFDTMDHWCHAATTLHVPQGMEFRPGTRMFVPTRLTQLLHCLCEYMPEHRLFALDMPQQRQWWYWLYYNNQRTVTDAIQVHQLHDVFTKSEVETVFAADFASLKRLYALVSDGLKLAHTEPAADFASHWTDLRESEELLGRDLSAEYASLQACMLSVMRAL
ncbi:AGR302Cp [Eremothecium gossypii ATCC 10895]|uniref:Protein arginine methyltransferase NDUFAF7 n=1 Tax=Eremothecium gossypii (strain ATCC 10895 / CBS 109.51 / FGSC 9923 / NRRL Y-1056) TaxID=284811 RepID=Q74ZA1_EREGS|nr:AGR302Cp [Eremothecium gossypii ATCC 10895]AAS54792.2 AGR302Cp [Eremothecium gossypii ATCC 10895]AEY99124.1 FAGR302Cp [Eremothecium gossypii FDAG1]